MFPACFSAIHAIDERQCVPIFLLTMFYAATVCTATIPFIQNMFPLVNWSLWLCAASEDICTVKDEPS